MGTNVFGNPVTDDTVRLVYPKVTEITAKHRAKVALRYKNADERAVNASKFVHNLKEAYGDGTSTLCMVYNATGGDLTYVLNHRYAGEVWKSPYPSLIQNGQWGAFLHVREFLPGNSKEAVVYNGKNDDGIGCDWMLAWNTAPLSFQNRVYTEIREEGHFRTDRWGYIDSLMDRKQNHASDVWKGCKSTISVGEGSSPELIAIMTLDNLQLMMNSADGDADDHDDDDDGTELLNESTSSMPEE